MEFPDPNMMPSFSSVVDTTRKEAALKEEAGTGMYCFVLPLHIYYEFCSIYINIIILMNVFVQFSAVDKLQQLFPVSKLWCQRRNGLGDSVGKFPRFSTLC